MAFFRIETGGKFNIFSKEFWIKIVIMTIAIWIVSFTGLVEHTDGPFYALLAAIIISLLNAVLRPILSLISMPLIIFSFGVFMLIINALIILLTSYILSPHFVVSGFINALFFSIIVTILTFLMNLPRKLKKVTDNTFGNTDNPRDNYERMNENNYHNNNNESSNRFDNDPFNDDPKDKNYTDFEDIDK